jgi:hypothetical protein
MEVISRPFWHNAIAVRSQIQGHNWLGVILLLLLLALFGLLQLDQQATTTNAWAESRALDAEYLSLQRECRYWQAEGARQASMEVLMAQAPQLTLYPPQQIVTVQVPAPQGASQSPAQARQALVQRERVPADAESLWWYRLVADIEAWIREASR